MTGPLLRLTIEGFGLIDRAEVHFDDGLTVFTGETGSGKTMLLGALDAALGARVDSDLVRGERARVTLEVAAGAPLRATLDDAGIVLDADDDIVILREMSAGRSQARINGVAVSLGQLRTLGAAVLDAIGQHEAQRLLSPGFALDALDRLAGDDALHLRADVRRLDAERRRLTGERDRLRDDDGRTRESLDQARFARDEIDAARLQPGEDDALRARRETLANAARIVTALAGARAALDDDNGAIDALGTASVALTAIAKYGDDYATFHDEVDALQSQLTELATRIARASDDLDADPNELDAIVARLDALESLKKKYGGSLGAVLARRESFVELLDRDAGRDERVATLERDLAAVDTDLAERARQLSDRRAAAAADAQTRIAKELGALAMPAARFTIALEPLDGVGATGGDRAEFRFSANPGEPERPLAKTASGGERSRVLLALVVVLAAAHDGTALVFDEIDAGIGGNAATAVGARLGRLARSAQVVCVTHLAQIAACADRHYALRKRERGDTTSIDVVAVDDRERLAEIARMLSGDATPISLDHAATLLDGARAAVAR